MKLIYFFDDKIKPFMVKGKKYANPTETKRITEEVSCIREYDVNFWFYTKENITIAFDSGHLNYKNVEKEFDKIGICNGKINHVFLTRVDVDHAGGLDVYGNNIFPNAQIYLGAQEEQYLTKQIHRFMRLGFKINNCVELSGNYQLLEDMQVVEIEGIKIQAIHIPGHTLGHVCYIIDDRILISGDCLAVNKNGGYSFFDFFTQYPEMNKQSLGKLKSIVEKLPIELICTGHSGYYRESEKLFRHMNESARFSKKAPFDSEGPIDLFE